MLLCAYIFIICVRLTVATFCIRLKISVPNLDLGNRIINVIKNRLNPDFLATHYLLANHGASVSSPVN